jgi:hypothetical protein
MTPEEGTRRLVFHASPEPGSFLAMLQPFRGLDDEVLEDLDAALRACGGRLSEAHLRRDLVSAVWIISRLGRLLAIDPGGQLRRNGLIPPADQARLAAFLARFDEAVMRLLEGTAGDEPFRPDQA